MSLRHIGSLLAGGILIVSLTVGRTTATSPTTASRANALITNLITALNAGMQSGDFSAVGAAYTSDAVLTVSNPLGKTIVFHGPSQIEGFYQGVRKAEGSPRFTIEHLRMLTPSIVLNYEHAGHAGEKAPARCAHLYVFRNNLIETDDFIVFFPAQK